MNNEPVAWMQTWQNRDGKLNKVVNIEQIGKNDIPLYPHPVKELTDEEILHQNLIWGQRNGEDYSMLTVEDIKPLISLVRAILRKAQEK